MRKIIIFTTLILSSTFTIAVQKKLIKEINLDAFSSATMPRFQNVGNGHMAIVWWIPNEFWESVVAQNTTTSVADRKSMVNTFSGTSLLAVVQADISSLGAFTFYSKEEIQKTMQLSFVDKTGKKKRLRTMQTISADLELLLNVFKPILSNAMGNMGDNMHFFVLNDQINSKDRLLNPYKKGAIYISLKKKNGDLITTKIEFPLDILFVPRKCPNGKDAHISWNYCPWTGTALKK